MFNYIIKILHHNYFNCIINAYHILYKDTFFKKLNKTFLNYFFLFFKKKNFIIWIFNFNLFPYNLIYRFTVFIPKKKR